ncbi:MAG: grasp-with-spasm system ATP-grasp peptide maturase [Salegentibacter mishustinae]|nr:grasp-with-spasm system ATP-grasp peptide maturase [Salegentibacter mishustinae]
MILIFSIENDISTTSVTKILNHLGKHVVVINPDSDVHKLVKLNTSEIIFENTITKDVINVMDVESCWWRRAGLGKRNFSRNYSEENSFVVDGKDLTRLIAGSNNHITSESKDLIGYIFEKVYKKSKINIGGPNVYHLNRLLTLEKAREVGLQTPGFEVVTSSQQIIDSDILSEKFVTKSVANGVYKQIGKEMFYSYTELSSKEEFLEGNVNFFPSLLMNLVEKDLEIRTFYLDGSFYSMAIFSQSNQQTSVDFRKYSADKPNKTEPYKLPKNLEIKLEKLFHNLGLNCGSVDLILNKQGNFVFLEINPVGQYQMTSRPGNFNLDLVIAKYLINGRTE